jgi:hypothetical protein
MTSDASARAQQQQRVHARCVLLHGNSGHLKRRRVGVQGPTVNVLDGGTTLRRKSWRGRGDLGSRLGDRSCCSDGLKVNVGVTCTQSKQDRHGAAEQRE